MRRPHRRPTCALATLLLAAAAIAGLGSSGVGAQGTARDGPGATVRARVGDRIRFSMTDRSDETVPGVKLTAAPMMHSTQVVEVLNGKLAANGLTVSSLGILPK